jgi:hypothetical protein
MIMARNLAFDDLSVAAVEPAATTGRPSFWSRLINSLAASRRASADREIATFIAANGGQLTDHLEREISRRFGYAVGDR